MRKGDKVSIEELKEQGWEYHGMHFKFSIWGQDEKRIFWNQQDEIVYLVYEKSASFYTTNKHKMNAQKLSIRRKIKRDASNKKL